MSTFASLARLKRHENMNANDYQKFTRTTAIYPKESALPYLILGLVSEAGEVAGKYKKVLRDTKGVMSDLTKNALIDETADCLWYISEILTELGVSMETAMEINKDKLTNRQTRGTLTGSGDNR